MASDTGHLRGSSFDKYHRSLSHNPENGEFVLDQIDFENQQKTEIKNFKSAKVVQSFDMLLKVKILNRFCVFHKETVVPDSF